MFMGVARRCAIISLVLFAGIVMAVGVARAGVFNPQTFRLKNGMEVVLIPNHRMPVVRQMVWYKAGAIDEPKGKTGVAHLLEHLMFKGTKAYPGGAFSVTVARNGGQENAFTAADYTAYFQTVAKDRLPLVMKMEADRMTHLTLTPEDVRTERKVVFEERHMRVDNNPAAVLREKTQQRLFAGSPYAHPVIGYPKDLSKLTRADVLTFYHRHYAPNNAVLVIEGDVTMAELKPLAEKYYGVIPPAKVPPRPSLALTHKVKGGEITLADPRVRQPNLSMTYIAPSYTFGGRDAVIPLEVLNEILSGGPTSRLYRDLVVKRGIAVDAGSYYDGQSLGPGRFVLYASPKPGVPLSRLEAALKEEVHDLLARGISPEELERARRSLLANAVYARDSLSAGAMALGGALVQGRSVYDVESWPDRIRGVSRRQVMRGAREVLGRRNVVVSRLMGAPHKSKKTASPPPPQSGGATPAPTPKKGS
ncbi:M16 family metallopeptidase [Varunaivibrio sulfuroxidans]|uniref:Zinc protease n=1 Tax=Varunaivibrio sulfuroxidans TaxID=1773489 RepID=A0A4R3J5L4_9PROT|nr:pitrilysin family protein [Varunaivibrio sulfuroxidans]TCS60617.1 zinc protease [Varunaivibrio sulfuroxidans]WES30106.1 pitrilysin family protein [Varunaivibrio sulfuroxidans]